ncbi:MAG: 2-C-methyl-D-erythritol 4-phosphate cytidylyltransferase [Verrucomicrobiota bacterium]|nr:2-C-methyl-D-erythritol 4-phosphate cytidylyltransferase [Verrucomicrobiota bacterium]
MSSIAILLAAGSGQRMQGQVEDKILVRINGQPALVYSLKAFDRSCVINSYMIVYRDEIQKKAIEAIIAAHGFGHLKIQFVLGGAERQLSVMNALNAVDENNDYVFIHDCARPCIQTEAIKNVYLAAKEDQAASLAHPVVDTIKRTEAANKLRKISLEDLDRSRVWAMETPQAFAFKNILKAYQNVIKKKLTITDDTAALATIGLKTTLVPNKQPNPKLTTPIDLVYIEQLQKLIICNS